MRLVRTPRRQVGDRQYGIERLAGVQGVRYRQAGFLPISSGAGSSKLAFFGSVNNQTILTRNGDDFRQPRLDMGALQVNCFDVLVLP